MHNVRAECLYVCNNVCVYASYECVTVSEETEKGKKRKPPEKSGTKPFSCLYSQTRKLINCDNRSLTFIAFKRKKNNFILKKGVPPS